jgi:hypothetical protein
LQSVTTLLKPYIQVLVPSSKNGIEIHICKVVFYIRMQEHDSSKKTNKLASLKLDADLSTLLQNASVHIQDRTRSLSEKIDTLDQKMRSVQTNALGAELNFTRTKNSNPTRFEISDDGSKHGIHPCQDKDSIGDKCGFEEEQVLKEQEDRAIRDGLEALKFYHDYSRFHENDHWMADHYFSEVIDSASDFESTFDVFNQRPLPFVIGSKAFMESSDGGLGSEDGDSSVED